MPEYYFNREQTAFLITLYEKFPLLYEVHAEPYKNKTKRQSILETITAEFQELFPDAQITVADIKKKINSVRTQYFSELNKVKKSIANGATGDDIYKPTLWCYDQLGFLNGNGKNIKDDSNLSFDLESLKCETVDVVYERASSPVENKTYVGSNVALAKRRKLNYEIEKRDTVNKLLEHAAALLQEPKSEPDHIEAFCLMVASELRLIKSPEILRQVKKNITTVLFEAVEQDSGS